VDCGLEEREKQVMSGAGAIGIDAVLAVSVGFAAKHFLGVIANSTCYAHISIEKTYFSHQIPKLSHFPLTTYSIPPQQPPNPS
jgi:hypothetical protein